MASWWRCTIGLHETKYFFVLNHYASVTFMIWTESDCFIHHSLLNTKTKTTTIATTTLYLCFSSKTQSNSLVLMVRLRRKTGMSEVGFFAFFIPSLFQKADLLWSIKQTFRESESAAIMHNVFKLAVSRKDLLHNSLSPLTFIKLASLFHSALTCDKL